MYKNNILHFCLLNEMWVKHKIYDTVQFLNCPIFSEANKFSWTKQNDVTPKKWHIKYGYMKNRSLNEPLWYSM